MRISDLRFQIAEAHAVALANAEAEQVQIVLCNISPLDEEGWALIAPFGEWPKTRRFADNGEIKEQQFIQVLDNESADALLSKENSFFGKLKRALIGIPVYKGHGDLKEVDPKAISNDAKLKLGVVDQIRKGDRGVEAHFALDNDGADAVNAGHKYPSALWWVQPIGSRGAVTVARPIKLISVALTPYPNISSVDSLANARPAGQLAEQQRNQETKQDMKLLAGWLLAQGVVLANTENPSEALILEGFQKLHTDRSGQVTALGNDKTTLTGRVTALENELAPLRQQVSQAQSALSNEQTARKAERKGRAEAATDLAIHRGILTIAEREDQVKALENSTDFEKDYKALLDKTPTHKTTTNGRDMSGKQGAALENEQAQARAQYDEAFKAELIANGQDPVRAHHAVMTLPKYAGLAQKLAPKK